MALKELYLGKCLSDLEQLFPDPSCKGKQIKILMNTANKLYAEAEKFRREADEEKSYVFFMRYFSLIDAIRKNVDFTRDKSYVSRMLGGSKRQAIALDIVTDLSNSLRRRYNILQKTNSANTNNTSNNFNNNNNNNNSDSSILPENSIIHEEAFLLKKFVTCEELFQMIKKQKPAVSLLIMDCRSAKDFQMSRLNYSTCLNVPREILKPGMSAGRLQQHLEEQYRALWSSRLVKDHIVLMDWDCSQLESTESEIFRLRDILQNYDPDVTYRSTIKILQGGYENLIMMYPSICTNPHVSNPMKPIESQTDLVDDVEYPSINDITMKDETLFTQFSSSSQNFVKILPPSIDRSSKLVAEKTYADKQKFEILQEHEALLDKALENDQILLNASEQLKNVDADINQVNNNDKKNLLKLHQDLLYKVYELENNERDFKTENKRLEKELDAAKKREAAVQQNFNNIEAETLEKLEKRIEEKAKKQKLFEKLNQERQIQFKRPLSLPYEDGISKPNIPQFDRSVKPINNSIPEYFEIKKRDFSPVKGQLGRGLTGLKNLGNTCYMNSIMQCLSNTGTLTNYFVTNNYKNHVNHENKTKGKIAEEVAALIKVLWNGQYKCIASKDLRYTIGQYQHIFSGIEQQDSHEFLTILMDWLHSDLQTLKITESPRRDHLHASEKSWLDFTKSCESFILQLFYGQIKSTVKCVECKQESATYECFSNLSLELPASANRCELNNCLTMYFSGESIRGWNCPNCKQKRDAIKKLSVSKLPPILVIHLKRFFADPGAVSNTYKKKQNYVNFPLNQLDMTLYIAQSEKRLHTPKTYDLYGISNHYGSMESGHYTAFCKSIVYNKWFKYDDTVVSNLDSSDVISSAAYILFYTNVKLLQPSDI